MNKINAIATTLNGLIDMLLVILSVLLLLIGAYIIYDMIYIYNGAAQKGALIYKPQGNEENAEQLKEISKDCVGWITIDGTNIDYPLMQGQTNAEYLNTDPFGDYSLSGSIFLDSNNNSRLTDDYSVIYGHHMEGGAMFGALDKYLDQEYFKSHRTGRITLTDGEVLELRIFAVLPCGAKDPEIFDISEGGPSMDFITEKSKCSESFNGGQRIALTTCFGINSDDRLAVLAEILK